jgi:hypothetical protein
VYLSVTVTVWDGGGWALSGAKERGSPRWELNPRFSISYRTSSPLDHGEWLAGKQRADFASERAEEAGTEQK